MASKEHVLDKGDPTKIFRLLDEIAVGSYGRVYKVQLPLWIGISLISFFFCDLYLWCRHSISKRMRLLLSRLYILNLYGSDQRKPSETTGHSCLPGWYHWRVSWRNHDNAASKSPEHCKTNRRMEERQWTLCTMHCWRMIGFFSSDVHELDCNGALFWWISSWPLPKYGLFIDIHCSSLQCAMN